MFLFLFVSLILLKSSSSFSVKNNHRNVGMGVKVTMSAVSTKSNVQVGSANLDWTNLNYEFRPTNSFLKLVYRAGKWENMELKKDPYVSIHVGATALHYGQSCFEGMKAFHCKDGYIRVFRPNENAKRFARSCHRICMPTVPEDLFLQAINTVVADNIAYIPPYGSGGSLYVRPVMFGSGARIGLQPADEYILCISVLPVAKYYKNGIEPVQALVLEDFDRAATKGVGNVKVAGNYAPAITPTLEANKSGYSVCLYLDSKTETYVEEFATSNFIAIEKESGAYVTPESGSVLPSVTNKSLMQLAESEGRTVLQRPIKIDEVMDGKFSEIASYGTAAIVTPVHRISYKNNIAVIGNDGVGPYTRHLCDRMKAIQYGEEPDVFGWMMNVC